MENRLKKYKKKPVVIDAVRFSGSSTHVEHIETWMATGEYIEPELIACDITDMHISTLEGVMTVKPGDYIVKGIKGEFYPCKPDIFEEMYDEVEND